MRLYAGTSGYAYDEWRGPFYPESIDTEAMLGFYAGRLETVEINNTFYRMPKEHVLERWAAAVPEGFRFAIKASQRITHRQRLRNADESVEYLLGKLASLGETLGPILVQCPPNLKKDLPLLESFLSLFPKERALALEVRSASWLDDPKTLAVLRAHGRAALCVADHEEDGERPALHATAPFGYLRLRAPDYDDEALRGWIAAIRAQPWEDVYVYFKHEDEGAAPRLAARMRALWDG